MKGSLEDWAKPFIAACICDLCDHNKITIEPLQLFIKTAYLPVIQNIERSKTEEEILYSY